VRVEKDQIEKGRKKERPNWKGREKERKREREKEKGHAIGNYDRGCGWLAFHRWVQLCSWRRTDGPKSENKNSAME